MNLFTLSKCRLFLAFIFTAISFQSLAVTKTSTGSGTWNTASRWSPSGVPAAGDDVVIAAGHTVTLNTNSANLASLSVNGTLAIGNNLTARTLTVAGNVNVASSGTISIGLFSITHSFNIGGNLVNDNSFDMRGTLGSCNVTFSGAANQTISGTGTTTDFNRITINNTGAANNNIVEVMPSAFSAAAGFLTLTQGIIKMSGTYSFTNTFITEVSDVITINPDEGIWLNNPNVTVTGQSADTRLFGMIRVTSGIFNIGTTGSDWWLLYDSGSVLTIEGGAVNVGGAFAGNTPASSDIVYTQSGGVFTTNTMGNTAIAGDIPSFGIEAAASVFTMSGGAIVLQGVKNAGAGTLADYINQAGTSTVTGGIVQVGNISSPAPASSYRVLSTVPIYNFIVNNTNSPTAETNSAITVLNDVTISTGASLDVSTSNNSLSIGHDFINNGTFVPQSGTVTFNGSGLQNISGTTATTFNSLAANNTSGKTTTGITLNRPTTVTNTLTLTKGHITTSSTNILIMTAGSNVAGSSYGAPGPKIVSGGDAVSFVNGPMQKIGNTAFLFPVGKISTGTATSYGHHPCGISAPALVTDVFTAEYIRGSAAYLGSVSAAGLDHVSNCEYWDIARTTGTSSVNVSLSWTAASDCNTAVYVNDLPTIRTAHFNGSTWDSYGGLVDIPSAVTEGSVTWNGVSTFSLFALGSTSAVTNPLPVKLANVKAYRNGSSNTIEWSNLTEMDVLKYEVEKSTGGNNFNGISAVAPRSNSTGREDYEAADIQPALLSFYRIKVTSLNGEILYSPVVKVTRDGDQQATLTVYPNPVTGRQLSLYIYNNKAGAYSLRIYAANGQLVKTETFRHPGGSYSRTVELPGQLQAGQYFVQAVDSDGQVSILKLMAK